jgi:hypothetical protein
MNDVRTRAWEEAVRLMKSGPHRADHIARLPDSPCPYCRAGEDRISYGKVGSPERRILHNPVGTIFGSVACADPRIDGSL